MKIISIILGILVISVLISLTITQRTIAAVDDISDGTGGGTDTLTVQHTCEGTETNGILIVTVQVTDSALADRTISSVTHNNEALTHLMGADADDGIEERTEIWFRANPTTGGTPNIVVTAGGSCTDISLGAISLTGVVNTSLVSNFTSYIAQQLGDMYGGGQDWEGQSFTGNGGVLSDTGFHLLRYGTPTGTIVAKIFAHTGTFGSSGKPTGSFLETSINSIDVSTITNDAQASLSIWSKFQFSGITTLTDDINYFIVLDATNVIGDVDNRIRIRGRVTDGLFHPGNRAYSSDGVSWAYDNTDDISFYVISGLISKVAEGDSTPPTLDITTIGDSSYVIDSLAIAESDGTKIATDTTDGQIIHKTDVGGDTHASTYVDAGGAGVQTMSYSDVDADTSWVMSAVAVQVLAAGDSCDTNAWDCTENCDVEALDAGGNVITAIGEGVITIAGDITNCNYGGDMLVVSGGCEVVNSGYQIC